MEYISEEKTIAVGCTKNPDMHGWVSLPDPMASGHTSNSRNTRDCLQSEEKSMSLGIILRKGDFFYYAADSRCKLLVDAKIIRLDDEYKKVFLISGTAKPIVITGTNIINGVSAEKIVMSSSSIEECAENLKQLNVVAYVVEKVNNNYFYKDITTDNKYQFLDESIHFSGHPHAVEMLKKLHVTKSNIDEYIVEYLNNIFNIFTTFPELVDNSIGGSVNIFKQEYGHSPVRLQGWYDL